MIEFYDRLAPLYHLIYHDWGQAVVAGSDDRSVLHHHRSNWKTAFFV
jgi:hypothetical protein